jgi:hypothetical protein
VWAFKRHAAGPPSQGLGMLSVGGIYSWGILGRPITLMTLEALFFCCLVVLVDQYKQGHSLPWPLHRLPEALVLARARVQMWWRRIRGSGSEQEGYHGVQEDPNIEMTHQEVLSLLVAGPGRTAP